MMFLDVVLEFLDVEYLVLFSCFIFGMDGGYMIVMFVCVW